ncbi:ABC transporter substrate-binding protein [Catenulispora sp. NF23]|uniref:ABC transporter substrate-binding protein n=1 Tax=Catenulispora pinistramenti TaxID=2705254 RepID=UPI001BA51E58|nr:ABC transporter substrate-binding protein [Catenulispora pinistramenti]MBS2532008.1 ABC transporter substrate-binding protein [Catenulispora pinistramenti]
MRRTAIKGLALVAAVGLSLAACSSSKGSNSSDKSSGSGKVRTLVVEDKPVASFTDDFNPFDGNSFLSQENARSLFYEPLYQFNTLNSAQAPIPWLASNYTWSNGNKTLTFALKPGVKWSDGQAFTSDDVAFTFTMLKNYKAANTDSTPIPDSVATPDPNTVVLNYSSSQAANFQGIANQIIVPKHKWSAITNPDKAVVTGADSVGTGPYLLDKFTPQNITLKANTGFRDGAPAVKKISFPAYADNNAATLALANGDIDLTGNDINDVLNTFVAKSKDNHLFQTTAPYFPASNTVALLMNEKSPSAPALADVAVRKAISAAMDRTSMATQCETNYELPATSSGGLTLPIDQKSLAPAQTNDLKPGPDPDAVSSLLTADGYAKNSAGKWAKNGATIKFTIIDPNSFTDYWCDAEALVKQLNGVGFDIKDNGAFDYNSWNTAVTTGSYDATLHWGQGTTPFQRLQFILDSTLASPAGQNSAGDFGHYQSSAADAAVAAYEGATSPADQTTALNTLQGVFSSDVPAVPVLYGAAWYEFSTANFTGWPTSDNPYINPSPRSQDYEYLILKLTPKP